MVSRSEGGYAKVVTTFEILMKVCKGYGARYKPSATAHQLIELETKLQGAVIALKDCKSTEAIFNKATDRRQEAFENLLPLCTQVVNLLAASGVSQNTVDGANTILRKLRGQRAGKIKPAEPAQDNREASTEGEPAPLVPVPNTISVSQQSYDYKIDYFDALISYLSTHPEYHPYEHAFQTATLQAHLDSLRAANSYVMDAYTDWSNSRINRDNIFYTPQHGVAATGLAVKKYVKGAFGSKSQQYSQVKSLYFRNKKLN